MKKISLDELALLIADPGTPEEQVGQYVRLDEGASGPFAPVLEIDPNKVAIPATPAGRARGDAIIGSLNWASRMKRRARFEERMAGGYDGPVIVSEGDSWFQYPWRLADVIDHLMTPYAILSLDAAGDTLENMAREREYMDAIAEQQASVFLLSAGGNDALGGGNLRQHLRSYAPDLSASGHLLPSFDVLIGRAAALLDGIFRELERAFPKLAVICHGYDYTIPKGGKWLGKPMASLGIRKADVQAAICAEMVDRWNGAVSRVARGYPNVMVVDNRGSVGKRWSDELHPTDEGFADVAANFKKAIEAVVPKSEPASALVSLSGSRVRAKRLPRRRGAMLAAPLRLGKARRKARSLHIGLNVVDPNHYAGWDGKLNACHNDAVAMEAVAKSLGYQTKCMLSEGAKRDNVIEAIGAAAKELKPGDIFLLTYSGHGGQVPDVNRDEQDDDLDETWCLYDAQLIDDESYTLWSKFDEDVRVVVISDSCHSGSVIRNATLGAAGPLAKSPDGAPARAMPFDVAASVYMQNRDFYRKLGTSLAQVEAHVLTKQLSSAIAATVRLVSGCQDNQLSYDGIENGQFTSRLLRVWGGGTFTGNYDQLHRRILELMPPNQTPRHSQIGRPNPAFDAQRPFEI
jgi:hypothetical protein